MKNTFLKYALLLMLPVGMLFSSCNKDDDDDSPSGITVEYGTITYNNGNYFAFKDYGKTYAYTDGATKYILDVNASKVYVVNTVLHTYTAFNGAEKIEQYSSNIFFDNLLLSLIPGVTRSTVTIAGKPCTKYAYTSDNNEYMYAVWSGLLFKINDGFDQYEATNFNDAKPADSVFSLEGYQGVL